MVKDTAMDKDTDTEFLLCKNTAHKSLQRRRMKYLWHLIAQFLTALYTVPNKTIKCRFLQFHTAIVTALQTMIQIHTVIATALQTMS